MARYQPVWRVEMYLPRTEDPAEATILTPVAGASHSDPFRVTTVQGVAGWQPYLQAVGGWRGELDPLTKRWTGGTVTLTLRDRRTTTTSNLTRWYDAYIGTLTGKPRNRGCKVVVSLSTDGGGSFSTYFTGRLDEHALLDRNTVRLDVKGMETGLDIDVFVGDPASTVSGAYRPSMLPVGFVIGQSYGGMLQHQWLTGYMSTYILARFIALHDWQLSRYDNIFTADALDRARAAPPLLDFTGGPRGPLTGRVRITRLDTGATGELGWYGTAFEAGTIAPVAEDETGRLKPRAHYVGALPTSDPNYIALPPDGTQVAFYIRPTGPPTDAAPIIVSNTHPGQFIKDMLDGKWSLLDDNGDPLVSHAYDATALGAIIADPSFPLMRKVIRGKAVLWQELEAICRQYQLGYFLNEDGEVVVVDLRLPAGAPAVPTIGNDDVDPKSMPQWRHGSQGAITRFTATYYVDTPIYGLGSLEGVPDVPAGAFKEVAADLSVVDFGDSTLGEKRAELDADTFRSGSNETVNGESRRVTVQRQLLGLVSALRGPYAEGPQVMDLTCLRTAATDGVLPGDLRYVNVDELPNPGTRQRGGLRLVRVVSVYFAADGLRRQLAVVDLGLGSAAAAPTLANFAADAVDSDHGVQFDVTRAGNSRAVVQYAAADPAVGVRPPDNDASWTHIADFDANAVAYRVNPVPRRRIWLRGRTEPRQADGLQLPSAWAYPAGTGYVDLPPLPAPSGLVATAAYDSVRLTWTSGDTAAFTRVQLAHILDGVYIDVRNAPPGVQELVISGLLSGESYSVQLSMVDQWGNESDTVSASFATGGTPDSLPDVLGAKVTLGTLVGTA